MPTTSFRRSPRTRGPAMLVASAAIALLCAIVSISSVSLFPPGLKRTDFGTAGAVTHMIVDFTRSGITDRTAEWPYFDRVVTRADVVAHLMTTDPALAYIARRAHIPPDEIAGVSPVTIAVAGPLTEPGSEMRARDILLEGRPYRLEGDSRPGSPIVDIYAQAPSVTEAEALADAAIAGARDYF